MQKKPCQETCQHMMQQIICRGHKKQEGHTLTLKLSNAHNMFYCSQQLLTLPNYIQHDSKIIILTTVVSQFNNQRTLVLLKDNKILSETSNLACDKILWKTFRQSFMLLLKYGTKPKFLPEEITQLTFKALPFHQYKSRNLFTGEIRPSLTGHPSFFRKQSFIFLWVVHSPPTKCAVYIFHWVGMSDFWKQSSGR